MSATNKDVAEIECSAAVCCAMRILRENAHRTAMTHEERRYLDNALCELNRLSQSLVDRIEVRP